MNKLVFVTGAARGIGLKVIEKYISLGHIVVATDKEVAPTDKEFCHANLHWIKMDVSDYKEVETVVNKVESELGQIHILIHVAGVFELCPVVDTKKELWDYIFSINTNGVYHVTQTVSKKMMERRQGAIVVVSSNASKYPRMGMGAYAASKAAASMYVKCLALELAEYKIRCNIVSPGSTNTDMQRKIWNGADTVPPSVLEGDLTTYRLGIPLQKIAQPEEVAEAIYFLASEKASHITMEELTIDGGATMGV